MKVKLVIALLAVSSVSQVTASDAVVPSSDDAAKELAVAASPAVAPAAKVDAEELCAAASAPRDEQTPAEEDVRKDDAEVVVDALSQLSTADKNQETEAEQK